MPSAPSRVRQLAAALVLGTALAACQPMVANHGHRLDVEALAEIRPGMTSREEVMRLLGSPSSTSAFDDGTWYYVSQRKERMSFYQEQLVEQDVVAVHFDERGLVAAVDHHGLSDARAVRPVAETTPTHGNEVSIVQQFLGNLGRFSAPDSGMTGAVRDPTRR